MTIITRQYVDDNDLIARYLANKLTDSERLEFEAFVIDNPEFLRELDTTAQFKSGLRSLHRSGALEALVRGKPWWHRGGPIALAASIIFAVVGVTIWLRFDVPKPILAATAHAFVGRFSSELPIAGPYSIQRTRSSSYDATIRYPSSGEAIELRVKPEAIASPARYRIALGVYSDNHPIKPVAEISNLQPESDGFVPVYLNPSELTPAVYEIKISGDAGTTSENAESSFLIEITS